jgi:hypothetical protein
LNEIKQKLKDADISFRVLYRGPRSHDGRYRSLQKSNCLKENATHFSIYPKTPYSDFRVWEEVYSKLGLN